MRRKYLHSWAVRTIGTALLLSLVDTRVVASQTTQPVRVRAEVASGPYFVGQVFDLRVGVIAGSLRPRVVPPRITGARAWAIGTEVRPITATGIGSVSAQENQYVFRFRVLPARAGTLEIPAIQVRVNGRTGRSQSRSLSIRSVPLEGRRAEFLGGVGSFALEAEAIPSVVRIGQELDFRIKVTGLAALGMTDRPNLERIGRLSLGLRIEPRPDETSDEPPVRTFVYRLRPTRAGEAALPPVAIAAYDPSLTHYVTRVTDRVPIRVVAVPAFDPTTIKVEPPSTALSWPARLAWTAASLAALLFAVFAVSKSVRRRRARAPRFGPERARRFARTTARSLRPSSTSEVEIVDAESSSDEPIHRVARRIYHLVSRYLAMGNGESPGVLTPDEACLGVAELTGSDELARAARDITERCDVILYGDLTRSVDGDIRSFLDDARKLFVALGRVKRVHRDGR